jgi:anti-sigma28 factor (negative regulator of flagellin synthesis)
MSFTSQQKDGTAVIAGNTEIPLTKGVGYKARGMITAPAMQNTPSLPHIRNKKVLAVRQQLAEGRYDLDEHLDSAVDRLLVVATT